MLGLAALPAARSQEKSKPAPHSAQQGCSDDSAVWKIPSRAEMDRMQAELRAQLATLESERSQLQAEIGPEIQNEMMGAQAELRA
ncbi:MAG: hypothetical protein ACRETH_09085, partial [Steroidobacteraceae bacterium]